MNVNICYVNICYENKTVSMVSWGWTTHATWEWINIFQYPDKIYSIINEPIFNACDEIDSPVFFHLFSLSWNDICIWHFSPLKKIIIAALCQMMSIWNAVSQNVGLNKGQSYIVCMVATIHCSTAV